ncbi:MAG: hypothetical protein ACM3PE_11260 [Deltaproteobacteria bacterium]
MSIVDRIYLIITGFVYIIGAGMIADYMGEHVAYFLNGNIAVNAVVYGGLLLLFIISLIKTIQIQKR